MKVGDLVKDIKKGRVEVIELVKVTGDVFMTMPPKSDAVELVADKEVESWYPTEGKGVMKIHVILRPENETQDPDDTGDTSGDTTDPTDPTVPGDTTGDDTTDGGQP